MPKSAALVVREVLGTSNGAVQHVPPVDDEIAHDQPNESDTESVAQKTAEKLVLHPQTESLPSQVVECNGKQNQGSTCQFRCSCRWRTMASGLQGSDLVAREKCIPRCNENQPPRERKGRQLLLSQIVFSGFDRIWPKSIKNGVWPKPSLANKKWNRSATTTCPQPA